MNTLKVDTYGNPPKGLVVFAERHADKIREVGNEGEDGYWIYLRPGWCWDDQGLHTIHEYTLTAIRRTVDGIHVCKCKDCHPAPDTKIKDEPTDAWMGPSHLSP